MLAPFLFACNLGYKLPVQPQQREQEGKDHVQGKEGVTGNELSMPPPL